MLAAFSPSMKKGRGVCQAVPLLLTPMPSGIAQDAQGRARTENRTHFPVKSSAPAGARRVVRLPSLRTHAHTHTRHTCGKMVLLPGSHQKSEFDWGSQTVNGRLDRPSDNASIPFWARAAMSRMRSR